MFYDIFIKLCQKKGVTPSRAAEDCGVSRSNVSSWKSKGYTPRGDALQNFADYFGVTVDYLLGEEKSAPKEKSLPALDDEDRQDISKRLKETLDDLMLRQEGLMFDGEPLDDVTRELLETSLRNSMELAKRMAKARDAEQRKKK